MNNTTIARSMNGGITITTSEANFRRLEKAILPGCPFQNYFALDLLRDLFVMYSWTIKAGVSYALKDFLTLCNDAHAEAYRTILLGE